MIIIKYHRSAAGNRTSQPGGRFEKPEQPLVIAYILLARIRALKTEARLDQSQQRIDV